MKPTEKQLFIKRSNILTAGEDFIYKTIYYYRNPYHRDKGRVTIWKKVLKIEVQSGIINEYLYYINRNYVMMPGLTQSHWQDMPMMPMDKKNKGPVNKPENCIQMFFPQNPEDGKYPDRLIFYRFDFYPFFFLNCRTV
jgi:hypothetical protein